MAWAEGRQARETNEYSIGELTQAAVRLGGLSECFILRREADALVEVAAAGEPWQVPLDQSFSGQAVQVARTQLAEPGEATLHPLERRRLQQRRADYWLAVPILAGALGEEVVGLVVGLRTAPLSPGSGEQERAVLSLTASQLGLQWRMAGLEASEAAAKAAVRDWSGEADGLVQAIPTALILLDPDDTLYEANRAAEGLLGFQTAAMRGQPVAALFTEPALREAVSQAAAAGGGPVFEATLGDDPPLCLDVEVKPLFDRRGEVRRKLILITDQSLLRQSERLKTQFVSMISHELRTPLTSIKAFASTLLHCDGAGDEEQGEWLGIIDRECDRLSGLISDLLTISRLEMGLPLAMQIGPCSLTPLLHEVIGAAESMQTQHTFSLVGPADLTVEADHEKLKQVLTNLVTNAIKYSPRGGRVGVSLADRGQQAEIRVSDQGIGIRPEHQHQIFEKFYQVDGGSTRRVGGTGLGLYLSKRLIEAMDGQIWVESEPGNGSEFVVELPKRRHAVDRLGTRR